ncbi:hypothetical protein HYY75_06105, partial [bacterium]|nr:hypothetical protein [bacterium]
MKFSKGVFQIFLIPLVFLHLLGESVRGETPEVLIQASDTAVVSEDNSEDKLGDKSEKKQKKKTGKLKRLLDGSKKITGFIQQLPNQATSLGVDLGALQKWEYKVLDIEEQEAEKIQAKLSQLGEDGWECFAVILISKGARYHFRKKPNSALQALSILGKLIPSVG